MIEILSQSRSHVNYAASLGMRITLITNQPILNAVEMSLPTCCRFGTAISVTQ